MNTIVAETGKPQGFTLIELIVVIAVLSIIAMIAVPSYQEMVVQQRLGSAAQQLHTSLTLTRSEAIKRNVDVRIQRIGGTDWENGWELINVADNTVITTHDPLNSVSITPDPATLGQITFNRSGRSDITGQVFTLCSEPQRGGTERIIRIEISGMTRVERGVECPN